MPRPRTYKGGTCMICAKAIDESYISSDANLAEFFAYLGDFPDVSPRLLTVAADREREGRRRYGLSYLAKNNPREATEEIADLIIYCYLHWLRSKREGQDVDMAALLEAVVHGAQAYNALRRLGYGTT